MNMTTYALLDCCMFPFDYDCCEEVNTYCDDETYSLRVGSDQSEDSKLNLEKECFRILYGRRRRL